MEIVQVPRNTPSTGVVQKRTQSLREYSHHSFVLMFILFTSVPLYYIENIVRQIGLQSSLNQVEARNTTVMHELFNKQVSKGNHIDKHAMCDTP